MLIGWIIFAVMFAYLSAGLVALAVHEKEEKVWRYAIPFGAFFYADKFTGGFRILSATVKKWGKTVICMTVISALATIYALWGTRNLNEIDSKALMQIMAVPLGLCFGLFYIGSVAWALEILHVHHARFSKDVLLCMLILPIPFLLRRKGSYGA